MKKKGFTLIELLAVIVILAIIAIIVTPIITGVIKKAKDSADLRSAEAYVKAGENYFSQSPLNNSTLDTNVIDDLEVSSNKASDGSSLVVNSDGTTDMAIIIDDKCYRKTFSESIKDISITDINTDEDKTNCSVSLKSDYAFLSKTTKATENIGTTTYTYTCYFGIDSVGGTKDYYFTSINRVDSVPSTFAYSLDISDKNISNNASIMAYLVTNGTNSYDVYLVSSRIIAAPADSSHLFAGMALAGDVDLSWLNTYFATNMKSMFASTGGTAMTTLNLGDNFNAQNAIDMSYMFASTGYAKMTTLNIGNNFNAESAVDMSYMFENTGDQAMTSLDLGDNFNAKSALNMSYMFNQTGGSVLKSLDLGSNFNAESATNMSYMFYDFGIDSLNSLSFGDNFNSKNVTDMSNMFHGAGMRALETFNLGSSFYTSNVTNMNHMFYCLGSYKLTTFNLGDKFDTSNVTDMAWMFEEVAQNTTTFEALDLGNKFDTSNVTNMERMFSQMGRNSLKKLSLGDKFNTDKVINMTNMFTENYAMTELDLGPAFKNVTSDIDFGWHSNTLTVKVSSDIYSDATHLKLNKDSGTTITVSSTTTLVSTY